MVLFICRNSRNYWFAYPMTVRFEKHSIPILVVYSVQWSVLGGLGVPLPIDTLQRQNIFSKSQKYRKSRVWVEHLKISRVGWHFPRKLVFGDESSRRSELRSYLPPASSATLCERNARLILSHEKIVKLVLL